MSNTQTDRTVKRRHLHYVLRTGTPEPRTPMFDSVESWNWAVRISVVGLFVVALAVIAFKMASVVVPVVLAWVVATESDALPPSAIQSSCVAVFLSSALA
jgi:hypothetical protein